MTAQDVTDDIATLIKRLRLSGPNALEVTDEAADTLSRLTTPLLPEDRIAQAAKLIRERLPRMLDFGQTVEVDAILVGVEALARDVLALALPAPPLPEKIAGLIEQLYDLDRGLGQLHDTKVVREAADGLRELAQENARVEAIRTDIQQCNESLAQENEWLKAGLDAQLRDLENTQQRARIRELEAERDWLAKRSDDLQTHANAIRAKTIEECAQVADGWDFGKPIAKDIRALAQTDEPHPSSLMGHVERRASGAATDADLPTAEDVRGILKD